MVEREEGRTRLATAVDEAGRALLEAARSDPEHWFTEEDLVRQARGAWSSSEFMLALYELVDRRLLERDARFRVRLAA